MFLLTFALPFAAALLCLGLNRLVATRWLGVGAAGALVLAAGSLLGASERALPALTWAALGEQTVRLALAFDAASLPLAVLALCGGAFALLTLALTLPSDLRGFGGLFAALLLAVLATIAGLALQQPLLLPFAWSLAALFGFASLRASGTMAEVDRLPLGLLAGLAGALLLIGAALLPAGATADLPRTAAVLACATCVALLAFGAPFFHTHFDESAAAPAALVGILLPLGLPLLGGYVLIRVAAANEAAISPVLRMVWALLGLLTLLACAVGAARTTRLREILGWQLSAQLGLVFLAIAQTDALLPHAGALALLLNAMLTSLAGYLAIAALERRAGTDDLAEIGAPGALALPGVVFLFSAAAALGLPGTWGWWLYSDLIAQVRTAMPWLIAPLLGASALRALAYLAPLAAFWRRSAQPRRSRSFVVAQLGAAAVALPLLVWGSLPQQAWSVWMLAAQRTFVETAQPPAPPGLPQQLALFAAAAALIGLPLLAQGGRPRCAGSAQGVQNPALLTPEALGQSLRGVGWLANPAGFYRGAWAGLLRLTRGAAWILGLFEQRYYLAGLMIAIIIVIMLMI
jgi:formate hydrogenlyase subunit 3/multisubunit Na+/H+ antiporter MnhD subunit